MKIECYEGSSHQWSWLLKSGNGQVVARSDDSYSNQESVARAAENFAEKFKTPPTIVFNPLEPVVVQPPEA